MSVPDWSELTADQQLTLLTAGALQVRSGCELVDFTTLAVLSDLTSALIPAGGYVRWDGTNLVHRTSAFALREELAWGVDLLRLFKVWTDPISGVTCRGDRAVQIVSAPDQDLAATPTTWAVTGQDRTAWLDRLVGRSYSIAAGANVLATMRQVITDAGLSGAVIDTSASAATVPTAMAYPFLPVDATPSVVSAAAIPADSGRTSVDPSSPATWRQILSDLCELVVYAGPFSDASGVLQLGPYVDAALRDPSFTFNALDPQILGAPRSVNRSKAQANEWYFLNTALPDVGGVPATPVIGNGIAYRINASDGPSSVTSMKGLVCPAPPIQVAAADQVTLEAIADAQVAALKRTVKTASLSTRSFPGAAHFDVFRWVDAALAEGEWLAEAMSWNDPLDGGRTAWSMSKVA